MSSSGAIRSSPATGCPTTRCYGDSIPQQTTVWIAYDADYAVLRLPLRRSGPVGHQDVDHAPRQHLGRRLGRPQPRRARHRPALLSPDGQPERRPARHAQHRRGRRGHLARLGLGQRRPASPTPATPSRSACRCRASASRAATTCAWASCSGAASAARRVGRRGRRSSRATGCSRRTRRCASRICSRVPTREVIPSVDLFANARARDTPIAWDARRRRPTSGSAASSASRSTMTLDATVNPDFSQVESDAFQVEVNQRFPMFFSEKRPFFMEGAGIFNLAGTAAATTACAPPSTRGASSIRSSARSSPGSAGRVTFGTLTAVDQRGPATPSDPDAARTGSSTSAAPSTASARATTSARSARRHRPCRRLQPRRRRRPALARWPRRSGSTAFALASQHARRRRQATPRSGVGAQVNYSYETQQWVALGSFEHYDRDFRMDTAFINRVGITSGWGFGDHSFYPDKTQHPWIRRVSFAVLVHAGRARSRRRRQRSASKWPACASTSRARDSCASTARSASSTGAGERFDRGRLRAFGNVQLYRWLSLEGQYFRRAGDFLRSRSIRSRVGPAPSTGGFTLQPNGRLSAGGFLEPRRLRSRRDRPTGLHRPHRQQPDDLPVHPRLFVRGIAQFDSSRYRVLTDFLASYEPRPGTVVYAGYGSLLEQREFIDGQWAPGAGAYSASRRGLFFKTSYLHRF